MQPELNFTEKEPKYRLYSFVNYYLPSLQAGLQTAHCVTEFFNNYKFISAQETRILNSWAINSKTIIILNGGNNNQLIDLYNKFYIMSPKLKLPFTKFKEDEESLNNLITTVGIIVPENVYNYPNTKFDEIDEFTSELYKLYKIISEHQLAR